MSNLTLLTALIKIVHLVAKTQFCPNLLKNEADDSLTSEENIKQPLNDIFCTSYPLALNVHGNQKLGVETLETIKFSAKHRTDSVKSLPRSHFE